MLAEMLVYAYLHQPLGHLRIGACLAADRCLDSGFVAALHHILNELEDGGMQLRIKPGHILIIAVHSKSILGQVVGAEGYEVDSVLDEVFNGERSSRGSTIMPTSISSSPGLPGT